ncbi:MAG: arginine deiminase-related protein [Candidatus Saccharibacteria bacterium]|nr:arginine deiminase-related protein [Candidatus Saccharibacteria bacterium]
MIINKKVLMSGAEYFDDKDAINAYMDDHVPVDVSKAMAEHDEIQRCFTQAGIKVIKVPAPINCQDGVYAANWALISGNKAIMSNLPNKRQAEEPYAEKTLIELGFDIVKLPRLLRFSGQGDALPCGKYLFVGTDYRTSPEVHHILAQETGLEVVGVKTIPELDENKMPVINPITGWPDSFFYDLDLAIAVITPTLIAWCPEAFTPNSRAKIRAITDIDKIEVSFEEATKSSACNLVSTGETVIMGSRAPKLKNDLEARGFKVLAPDVTELMKGGGFIRCTSLII